MTQARLAIHPSWVIVGAGVCAALHVGKLPPALPVLQEALQISLVQAGFLLSAVQIASMTLGLVVGLSADTLGLRRSMLVGLALLLGPWVIAGLNWSAWWWLLGLLTALAFGAVWRCVPDAQAPAPMQDRPDQPWPQRLALTLRSPGPWLVALTFAAYSSQWLAVVGFLPTVYAQMGLAAGTAGVLSAGVALANVSGNILSGHLLQRGWPARQLLWTGFATMALGAMGAYAQWPGEGLPTALRFACVLMFSAVGGLIPGTLFSCALRLAPSEGSVSTTVGHMQQWSALGQFAGPPLVAWVATCVGGWQWTWAVTATLGLAGAVLAYFTDRALQQKGRP